MPDEQILSSTEVEDLVNEFAQKYAKQAHDMPLTAVKVLLTPTTAWVYAIEAGPTAIIRMGIMPGHHRFNAAMRRAIDHVFITKAYQCLALESALEICKRETELTRVLRVRYNFKRELVPDTVPDTELVVERLSRVQVSHRPTGLREVMECPLGAGNYWSMLEVAKSRLARRVQELQMAAMEKEVEAALANPEAPPDACVA